ncbi:hypothetical protein FZC75_15135 [Sutcliffiella horikoshii]|uniref:Uncharacterized protein n=1 Tax=Sutcliffiella horikoshii TaxID=79883 RepID=A0A5D4T6X3_9BACI|nr:hypothetical protein FZC75_15135 [Sutcliffiella horikoshii]
MLNSGNLLFLSLNFFQIWVHFFPDFLLQFFKLPFSKDVNIPIETRLIFPLRGWRALPTIILIIFLPLGCLCRSLLALALLLSLLLLLFLLFFLFAPFEKG